jgi:XTP/dITP diphosphohydrolase
MKIVLASTNAHKLEELSALLAGHDFALGPKLEVEETGTTFAENALIKAKAFLAATGQPALADDSGLAVEVLGGRPGVYSARYAPTDAERIAKLLGELGDNADRRAAFVCAMALALPDGRVIAVEGRCEGLITDGARGEGGFGYDPIFLVPGLGRTFAQLSAAEKNGISHRGRAVELLKIELAKLAPQQG